MPHTIRMMFAVENYLVSEGCIILGSSAKKLGPAARKVITGSLIEQSEKLPAMGLKRFVQHNDQGFLVHIYIEDWPDRQGATVNIHTYGLTTTKSAQEYPNFYKELATGRFPRNRDISLFETAPAPA